MAKANCNIEACENEAERTLGKSRIGPAITKEGLKLNIRPKVTKVKLCKEHYRKVKKHLKKADKLERARWEI